MPNLAPNGFECNEERLAGKTHSAKGKARSRAPPEERMDSGACPSGGG